MRINIPRNEYVEHFNALLNKDLHHLRITEEDIIKFEKERPKLMLEGYKDTGNFFVAVAQWKEGQFKRKQVKQSRQLGKYKISKTKIIRREEKRTFKATSEPDISSSDDQTILSLRLGSKKRIAYKVKRHRRFNYFTDESLISQLVSIKLDLSNPNVSQEELEQLLQLVEKFGSNLIPQTQDDINPLFQLKRELIIFQGIFRLNQDFKSFPRLIRIKKTPDYIIKARLITGLKIASDYANYFKNKIKRVKVSELEQVKVTEAKPKEKTLSLEENSISVLELAYWKLWQQVKEHEAYLQCGWCQRWILKENRHKYCSDNCANKARQARFRHKARK